MAPMSDMPLYAHPLRVADLPKSRPTTFELRPAPKVLEAIRTELDLSALRKLSFAGTLAPTGKADWLLTAEIGATAVQPCVVTLAPVTTRIDAPLRRLFSADMPEIDSAEVEMPVEETIDPLTPVIDLGEIMVEALALHLPDYPRAPGADLGEAVFAEPGVAPMRDEDARPFAGLAGLRDALSGEDTKAEDDDTSEGGK